MISIDIEKARTDAARLREIGQDAEGIAGALEKTCTEHLTAWQGDAGTEFQALAERLCTQISAFCTEAAKAAGDIAKVCDEFEAADSGAIR